MSRKSTKTESVETQVVENEQVLETETEVEQTTVPETSNSEYAFNVSELRANSHEVFSVFPEVFDGALHGYTEETVTVTKAKELIEKYLKRGVK